MVYRFTIFGDDSQVIASAFLVLVVVLVLDSDHN
jgi:hypothetical protein